MTKGDSLCSCGHSAHTHRLGPEWMPATDTRCRVESGCDCTEFVALPWLGELHNAWMGSGRQLSAHRRREKGPA